MQQIDCTILLRGKTTDQTNIYSTVIASTNYIRHKLVNTNLRDLRMVTKIASNDDYAKAARVYAARALFSPQLSQQKVVVFCHSVTSMTRL